MKKSLLVLLLGTFLGLGSISSDVYASQENLDLSLAETGDEVASGQCGETLYWSLSQTGVMTISGTGDMWNYSDSPDNVNTYACPWKDYSEEIISVVFEDGITSVGQRAFRSFENIESVTFSGTITKINSFAFRYCTKLQNLELPSGLEYLGQQAFSNCTSVTSVTIPDTVTYLGGGVFEYCTSLTYAYIGGDKNASGYAANFGNFKGCTALEEINVSEDNIGYTAIDGVLYSGSTLMEYPAGRKDSTYNVVTGTTYIMDSAFAEAAYLEEIIMPDTVETIGNAAFQCCTSLETVLIPKSVTAIANNVFDQTNVTLQVYEDSYALEYANENGMAYELTYDKTPESGNQDDETPGSGSQDSETPGSGSQDGETSGSGSQDEGSSGNGSETEDTTGTPVIDSSTVAGKERFVALLYENVLERYATESEIASWVQELDNGKTGAEVAYGFIFSQEFANKNLNDSDYIERLYMSMLGRASDVAGKSDWVAHLSNGVSRLYVFKQFVNSTEFTNLCESYGIERGDVILGEARDMNYDVTRFVARNYTEFLGRSYDVAGLNDWTFRINNRVQTMQEIAFGFVFSQECTNMNLSNEEYVQMLYRGCFDRQGEAAGVTDWVSQLNSGTKTREEVFWGFANSQEFANMVSSYGL